MTYVMDTAALRPQQDLKPDEIQPGTMFRGLVTPKPPPILHTPQRIPAWFMVQRREETPHGIVLYGTSYDGKNFQETSCFLHDFFILGWGSAYPRPTNPVVPPLVPDVCVELRKILMLAQYRVTCTEASATRWKRVDSPMYQVPDVEAALNEKAQLRVESAREVVEIIRKALQAWGLK